MRATCCWTSSTARHCRRRGRRVPPLPGRGRHSRPCRGRFRQVPQHRRETLGVVDIAEGPYPGGGDWTSPRGFDLGRRYKPRGRGRPRALTGAASKLFAGEAQPLIFRGGVDPAALLSEEPDLGLTIDEGDEDDAQSEPAAETGRGWFSVPAGAGREKLVSLRRARGRIRGRGGGVRWGAISSRWSSDENLRPVGTADGMRLGA